MKKVILFVSLLFLTTNIYAETTLGTPVTIWSHKRYVTTAVDLSLNVPGAATTNSVDATGFDRIMIKASTSSVYAKSTTGKSGNWYLQIAYYDSDLGRYTTITNLADVKYLESRYRASKASIQVAQFSLGGEAGLKGASEAACLIVPTYGYSNIFINAWKRSNTATSAITVIAVPFREVYPSYGR